jgi:RNA polymerase sigma factor (TIGR02999 family)
MGNITVLLNEIRAGNATARTELFSQVYGELTRIARARLNGAGSATLDAPSLVHEAYLALAQRELPSLRDRNAFFAYAAAIMRNVVIDEFRRLNAHKRGAGVGHLTLSNAEASFGADELEFETLEAALQMLQKIDPRGYRVVEMRFFGGLTNEEIAEVLELSPITVKRSWRTARMFLMKELQGP